MNLNRVDAPKTTLTHKIKRYIDVYVCIHIYSVYMLLYTKASLLSL